jgi:signal transduction histidine kinase
LFTRWLPRSLVGRVFALYSVTLVVFVVAGLGLFYRYQFSVELEAEQTRAEALALIILPTLSDSAVIGDDDTIAKTLARAIDNSNFESAAFIDLKGRQLVAKRHEAPDVQPPVWLVDVVAARLYDTNLPINAGGRDYGVLRLRFAPDLVAGDLWRPARAALLLAVVSLVGGLLLIRMPLVHWLGHLGRLRTLEAGLRSGGPGLRDALDDNAPIEFRQTFEVLNQAAENLQAQREQAAVTLGAIGDAVLTLDRDGRVVLANPAAGALLGQPVADLLGRPAAALLPGAFGAAVGAAVGHDTVDAADANDVADANDANVAAAAAPMGRALLAPWRARRIELTTADGQARVLDTTLSTIPGPGGVAVGHVLASRDITEQHQLDLRLRSELAKREAALVALRGVLEGLSTGPSAPAELRQPALAVDAGAGRSEDDIAVVSVLISGLVASLQERSEQLDAIFALSPDGFVSFDAQHRVSYVNPAFLRLTGLDAQAVLGSGEVDFAARLGALCGDAGQARGPDLGALRREARRGHDADDADGIDGGGGTRRSLMAITRPARRVLEVGLRPSQSAVISQVFHLRDVTHETEVDRIKSEFLSTAAHELRTPMASIYGFCELLLHRAVPPERQKEMLGIVYRQTQRMITILNELLDLARIESRRGTDFVLDSAGLADLVQEVLADFKPPDGRRAPELAPLAAAQQARVRVDRNKLHQALDNVLSNAYKYSPGGGPVRLTLLADRVDDGTDGDGVEIGFWGIRVEDNGMGMTPEQLARVSERFYRADASGNIPGTGLGMSIVKEIVELLGGRLELASQAGQGTQVTLWLPVAGAGSGAPASTMGALT